MLGAWDVIAMAIACVTAVVWTMIRADAQVTIARIRAQARKD